MLEVPEDFIYDLTPTLYGILLSVTIEKPSRDENEEFLLEWAFKGEEIDQIHF